MESEKQLLVEKLAEYAEHNRFTLEEFERLIRLSLELERECPGVQFVIPGGDAYRVEQELLRQAQTAKQADMPREDFTRRCNQAQR